MKVHSTFFGPLLCPECGWAMKVGEGRETIECVNRACVLVWKKFKMPTIELEEVNVR